LRVGFDVRFQVFRAARFQSRAEREIAVTMIEEISPQVKQDPATTMKLPEPRIIIGRRMDGEVTRVKNKRPP